MSWSLAFVLVGGMGALVALAHVALPYIVKRTDHETRLNALEAANAELKQTTAELVQFAAGGGALGRLPRAGGISR